MSQEPNVVQPLPKAIAVVKWKHFFDKEIGGVGQSPDQQIAGLIRAGATEETVRRFWLETKHLTWPASWGVAPWEAASTIGFALETEATHGAGANAFGAEHVALFRRALTAKNAEPRTVNATMDERYADAIIGSRPDRFDGLEIQGVREILDPSNPGTSCCEVDNDRPQFFSVYVHHRTGGVACVGDHGSHDLASAYASALSEAYGWPIHDYAAQAANAASSRQTLARVR